MRGTLFGIGVGPGDPELMTVKAVRTCLSCDVIAIPHKNPGKCLALQIALGAVPELAQKPILTVDMPMTKDPEILHQAHHHGAELVAQQLDAGKNIAFLTLGDPTVYSTYFYVHEIVAEMGYDTVIIPGITSFCAAAATLGIALCKNSQQLHIIPGTYQPADALELPGTKVLMKNNLPEIRNALKNHGMNACMVENCGLPDEKRYRSTAEIPEQSGYYTLLIVQE